MSATGRYIKYNLKSNLLPTLIFTIFGMAIVTITVPGQLTPYTDMNGDVVTAGTSASLGLLSAIISILCTVIPLLNISPFKNKRNLDTLFAMPLDRGKMAIGTFVSGYIQVVIIYTAVFLLHISYLIFKTDWFSLGYLPLFYISSLASGFIVYSFFSFIIMKNNTIGDGTWVSIMWIGAIAVAILVLVFYLRNVPAYYTVNNQGNIVAVKIGELDIIFTMLAIWSTPYSAVTSTNSIFVRLIENKKSGLFGIDTYDSIVSTWYMFIVWLAVGILAAYGFFRTFSDYRAYKAEDISTTWWGYKLLIPLYGYAALSFITPTTILAVFIFILMVVGYFIYRRSFKLKKSDIICLILGIIPLAFSPY